MPTMEGLQLRLPMPSMLGVMTSVDALAIAMQGSLHPSMPTAYNNHITPALRHDGALVRAAAVLGACAAEDRRMPLVRVELTTLSFNEMVAIWS